MHIALFLGSLLTLAAAGLPPQQTGPEHPTTYKVGGEVLAPVVVSEVPPAAPPDPLRLPPQGTIALEATIDPEGRVGDVAIVKSLEPVLDQRAVAALRQWRFDPAVRNGRPVAVRVPFEVRLGPSGDAGGTIASPDVVYRPGSRVTRPKPVKEVMPSYSAAAQQARTRGTVSLTCVVQADGTVRDIRITAGLDPSLDARAIDALRQWVFEPGRREGVAVPVEVSVEMAFELR